MRLTLGSRRYDLETRALVVGASGAPADLVALGADLVEVAGASVPVFASAPDDGALVRALRAGADLVHLADPTAEGLRACADAGAAVLVPEAAATRAAAAGLAADRVVLDSLLLDVTDAPCPLAATVAGVVRGARIVRTTDVRGARRVCDVLAAILEAGR